MLELPESITIARQAKELLIGKRIEAVTVGKSPHRFAFYTGDPARYPALLTGQTVRGARHHGGLVVLALDTHMLYFSDGAYPRYYESAPFPDKHQLLLEFDDATALSVSVQMYGGINLSLLDACEHGYYRSSADKPEPFDEGFTFDYFRGLYAPGGKKLTLKGFLATEQRIPGLGNGVLQDILWNAEMDPRKDMRQVDESAFHTLYDALRDTLRRMADGGGRSTERDLTGNPGGYRALMCKDTLGMPCPRCGSGIEKAAYMGGAVYFCPGCQSR